MHLPFRHEPFGGQGGTDFGAGAGPGFLPKLLVGLVASIPAAVILSCWYLGGPGGLVALLPGRGAATEPDGEITVTSMPPGAAVLVNGKVRGQTPLTVRLPGGERQVVLRQARYADLPLTVRVDAARPVAVHGVLWLQQPVARRLRPPLPGAAIAGAQFLPDGRVALTVTLPPGEEHQVWVLDATGGARRVGPAEARLMTALSPDGARVAYTAAPAALQGAAPAGERRATEVWIAAADGSEGAGTRRYWLPAGTAAEAVTDLAWAPDGVHLLLVAQLRAQGGALRTRFLWLDTTPDGGEPAELVVLPSDVVPGSWAWRPDGAQVSFIGRTDSRLALCLLGIAPAGRTGAPALFRYLAELPGGGVQPPHAPPIAWAPVAAAGDPPPGRFVYATTMEGGGNGLGFGGKPTVLLTDDLAGRPPVRLAGSPGSWPGWRADGRVLAIARLKGDTVALRLFAPVAAGGTGTSADLGTLPVAWGNGGGPEVRWDIDRGRALIFGGGSSGEGTELWLLDWLDDGR